MEIAGGGEQGAVEYGRQPGIYDSCFLSQSTLSTNLENDWHHSYILNTYVHTGEIPGLMANTTYYYRIGKVGDWSPEYSFRTGPPMKSEDNFRFIVGSDSHAGDSGSRRNELAYHIMNSFETEPKEPRPGLLFFGGDEIAGYNEPPNPDPNTVNIVARQWHRFFSPKKPLTIFKGAWAKLLAKVPYMTSDSNHVDSDDTFFDLFNYPLPFGTRRLSEKPTNVSNCLYTTSNPTQNQRGNNGWYSFNYGNAHFIVLQINTAKAADASKFCTWKVPLLSDQYEWLEKDLQIADADPKIRWKFAIWHSAPYSSKGKILSRNKHIQSTVCRLLTKYNVDMVFSGHQHRYERSKKIENGPNSPDHEGRAIIQGNNYKSYDDLEKGVVYVVTAGAGPVGPTMPVKVTPYTAVETITGTNEEIPFLLKANHYLVVDVDNTNHKLTCNVMGYEVKSLHTDPNFNNAPTSLDNFTIKKTPFRSDMSSTETEPNCLRELSDNITFEASQTEKRIPLSPPVFPNHAFVLVNASNNCNHNNPNTDNCDVAQVTGYLDKKGENLILERGEVFKGTSMPMAHVSYRIIESPDIKVQHGSKVIKKGLLEEYFEILKINEDQTIISVSSLPNSPVRYYHETNVMGDIGASDSGYSEISLYRDSGENTDVIVKWSAITFRDDIYVQKGWIELKYEKEHDVNIYPIDPSSSWFHFNTTYVGEMENYNVNGFISNSNKLTFEKSNMNNLNYPTIQWHVIEFPAGSEAFSSGFFEVKFEASGNHLQNNLIDYGKKNSMAGFDFNSIILGNNVNLIEYGH